MSSIINKVKDTLSHHGDNSNNSHTATTGNASDSYKSSNHGPHDSNLANKADPRIDSDRDGRATHTGGNTTHTGGNPFGTTTGTHESGLSSNHGPHDSNLANKADPRVDSDRSNYGANTFGAATHGGVNHPHGTTGTNTFGGNTYESGLSSNHGPHDSNLANKADPRIDSDRSTTHTTGLGSTGAMGSTGATYGATHSGATPSNTLGSSTGAPAFGSNYRESGLSSNHGPHDSNLANKADPRIDSDRSTAHTTGLGSTGSMGSTGATYGATHSGATPSNTFGSTTGANPTHGSNFQEGLSSNHGPHDSNLANKADPRVDSDRDGRATHSGFGSSTGNTFGSSTSEGTHPSTHSSATGPASNTAGPHESNMANKADPRVDSDISKKNTSHGIRKGSMGGGGVMHGVTGNNGHPTSTKTFEEAQEHSYAGDREVGVHSTGHNTAGSSYNSKKTVGPHSSDIANKLDPRVDSDLDGSKTLGSQRI